MRQLALGIGLTYLLFTLTGCASEVTLAVPDMMCEESCAVKVREVLAKQDGVQNVRVDFPKRIATLEVKPSRFDADRAIAALVDHGFEEAQLATGVVNASAPAAAQGIPTASPDTVPADVDGG